LWTRQWAFGFHERRAMLWLAKRLSQEGLCSMELINMKIQYMPCKWKA
jgi:hypothetical protein